MKLSKLIKKLQDFYHRCQTQPKPADPEVHFTIDEYNHPFDWHGLNNPYTFEPLWILRLEPVKWDESPVEKYSIANLDESLHIAAPEFELNDAVIVRWDGEDHLCRVVSRWYDLDNGRWYYELDNFKNPFDARGWFESISLDRG